MAIGTGILLIAVGAILRFAVNLNTSNVNWDIVGDVLMIVGALGVVLSLLWGSLFARSSATVADDGYATRRRERVVEDRYVEP
jgi:hypothetical protein